MAGEKIDRRGNGLSKEVQAIRQKVEKTTQVALKNPQTSAKVKGRLLRATGASLHAEKFRKNLDSCTVYSILCITHYMTPTTQADLELFENLRLELRRGCLVVAVLAQLRQERYGYTLRKALEDQGLAIDEGTLYPLLRRLESQGLLASEWREENKRNKRFYRLSVQGELILQKLLQEWQTINASLEKILQEA